jgi:hypothetical protein
MHAMELAYEVWLIYSFEFCDGFYTFAYTIHLHSGQVWTEELDRRWTPPLNECLKLKNKDKNQLLKEVSYILTRV